jgi:hypothetical protein
VAPLRQVLRKLRKVSLFEAGFSAFWRLLIRCPLYFLFPPFHHPLRAGDQNPSFQYPEIPRFQLGDTPKSITEGRKIIFFFFRGGLPHRFRQHFNESATTSKRGGLEWPLEWAGTTSDSGRWFIKNHFNIRLILLKREHEIQNYGRVVNSIARFPIRSPYPNQNQLWSENFSSSAVSFYWWRS